MNFVPVKSKDGERLMPTTTTRAAMMIKSGEATPYYNNGIFCIRLNVDNTNVFCISPFQVKRRTLHRQIPQKGGKRPRFGGTRCLGIAKNTLVKHIDHGLAVVCGHQQGGLSLQPVEGGKRLTLSAKLNECKILTKLNFRYKSVPEQPKVKQEVFAIQLTFL